jgi:hypothetical protein
MVSHTQIASIMEVLANAAVAEICKVVDDDYAVFRLEITQTQKENRTLRKKLQLLELKVARERVLASPSSVKIIDRYRGMARGTFSKGRGCKYMSVASCTCVQMCDSDPAVTSSLKGHPFAVSMLPPTDM